MKIQRFKMPKPHTASGKCSRLEASSWLLQHTFKASRQVLVKQRLAYCLDIQHWQYDYESRAHFFVFCRFLSLNEVAWVAADLPLDMGLTSPTDNSRRKGAGLLPVGGFEKAHCRDLADHGSSTPAAQWEYLPEIWHTAALSGHRWKQLKKRTKQNCSAWNCEDETQDGERVLLLSLEHAASGTNLTAANHALQLQTASLYPKFLDPFWSLGFHLLIPIPEFVPSDRHMHRWSLFTPCTRPRRSVPWHTKRRPLRVADAMGRKKLNLSCRCSQCTCETCDLTQVDLNTARFQNRQSLLGFSFQNRQL